MNKSLALLSRIAEGTPADELEASDLEFKQEAETAKATVRIIAEAAACLANADGGVIILGVADRPGGPGALIGCSQLTAIDVRTRVPQMAQPPLLIEATDLDRDGRRFIEIRILQGTGVHTVRGQATQRVGSACLPLTATEARAIDEARRGFDWSALPSISSLDSVNPAAVAAARRRLADRYPSDPISATTTDLLQHLGLLTGDGNMTNGAEVLFARSANARIILAQIALGASDPALTYMTEPCLLAIDRILSVTDVHTPRRPVLLSDGTQVERADIAQRVVREALANAIAHREHREPSPILVSLTPGRLEVSSPGPLPIGITPDNILTHPSKARNRTLLHALRILGIAEEVGLGMDRMFRDCLSDGHPAPIVEARDDGVTVTVIGGPANPAWVRFATQHQLRYDELLILRELSQTPSRRTKELAALVQRSPKIAIVTLETLSERGLIERAGSQRGDRRAYRLSAETRRSLSLRVTTGSGAAIASGSAIGYRADTTWGQRITIARALAEQGPIDNAAIRQALGVSQAQASRILGRLVEEGHLNRLPGPTRGSGVRYALPSAGLRNRIQRGGVLKA